MTIAAGFVLRVMAGAESVEIYSSNWFIICSILLSLFLGFGKRRHELLLLSKKANNHRAILKDYSDYFIDQMIGVVSAATIISYMLCTVCEETVKFFGTRHLIWAVPFVLFGRLRYLYLINQKKSGDPTTAFLGDIPMLIDVFLWGITCIAIIYFYN